MFHFLEERYKQLPSDDLGALLGDLSVEIWTDGTPGDPAVTGEWERALALAEKHTQDPGQKSPVYQKAS